LDPLYMSYIAKRNEYIPRFIEMASEINDFMRMHAVNLLEAGLSKAGKTISGSTVAILGLSYKRNVGDARETPSTWIIDEIIERGGKVRAYDPFIKSLRTPSGEVRSEATWQKAVRGADAAIVLVDHDELRSIKMEDVKRLMMPAVVIDCKNVLTPSEGVIYVGLGKPNGS
ncbi:MAG: hypothetical protein LUO79_02850, partial [Methanomassiliicoccales archaeon]|nr:hypothetical protein [Methanomassiliicoccales archaeon]